jgi:hypothetical protein
MATSVKLSFPSTAKVFVQAFSNASFNQEVTIQPPSGAAARFAGNSENNAAQKLITQGFLTVNAGGQPSFVVPGGAGGTAAYTISVTANGKPSLVMGNLNSIVTPSSGQILMGIVSSEDSSDKDWNDSVVIFTSYLPPS